MLGCLNTLASTVHARVSKKSHNGVLPHLCAAMVSIWSLGHGLACPIERKVLVQRCMIELSEDAFGCWRFFWHEGGQVCSRLAFAGVLRCFSASVLPQLIHDGLAPSFCECMFEDVYQVRAKVFVSFGVVRHVHYLFSYVFREHRHAAGGLVGVPASVTRHTREEERDRRCCAKQRRGNTTK